jgi:lysozyme
MNCSDQGLRQIMAFEGVRLTAYPDPATGGAPWTVGAGHTGPDVHPGMTITQDECMELLRGDIAHAEKVINDAVKVNISQNEFDALCSFVFNVGAGNFLSSTLLKLLNNGDYHGAANQFRWWDRAGGHEMPGLLKRRLAEAAIFNGEYTA